MRRQRGMALITAILLVALATILAATIGYENAMTARRGTATFAFEQSLEVSKAAEAIAAYALRLTRQKYHTTTYPAQPWSTSYGPVDLVPGVTLQARLDDTQGRFNLNNLVKTDGSTNEDAVLVFANLLTSLGLSSFLKFYKGFRKHLQVVEVASGVLLIFLGTLMAFNKLTMISGYFSFLNRFAL